MAVWGHPRQPTRPTNRGSNTVPFFTACPALRTVRYVGAAMKRGTVCGPSFEVPVSIQRPTQGNILFGIPFEASRHRQPKSSGHGFSTTRSSILGNVPLKASASLRMAVESGVQSQGFMRSCYSRPPLMSFFVQGYVCSVTFGSLWASCRHLTDRLHHCKVSLREAMAIGAVAH